MNNANNHKTCNENEHTRAAEVLREAMQRMEALNIDPSTAFESSVTYLTEWMLHVEGGEQILLNVAAHLQRCAIEHELLQRQARQSFN